MLAAVGKHLSMEAISGGILVRHPTHSEDSPALCFQLPLVTILHPQAKLGPHVNASQRDALVKGYVEFNGKASRAAQQAGDESSVLHDFLDQTAILCGVSDIPYFLRRCFCHSNSHFESFWRLRNLCELHPSLPIRASRSAAKALRNVST